MTSKATGTRKSPTSNNSERDTTGNWQIRNEINNNETATLERQRAELLNDILWTEVWLDTQYYSKLNALSRLKDELEDLHHPTMLNYTRQDPLQPIMAQKNSPLTISTTHNNNRTSAWHHPQTPPTNTQHHKQNPDSGDWNDNNNSKESPKSNEDSELEDLF